MESWIEKLSARLKDPLGLERIKALRRQLAEWAKAGDPRIALSPLEDRDWLCPYCAQLVQTPAWNQEPATVLDDPDVLDHLNRCQELARNPISPVLVPWKVLVAFTVKLRLRRWPNYRIANSEGAWVCPHCLAVTELGLTKWDGRPLEEEDFSAAAYRHLEACPAFANNAMHPYSDLEVRAHIEPAEIAKRLRERVAHEPVFQVFDETGNWLDPFAQRPVETLNHYRTAWGPSLREAIVAYLLSPACLGRKSGWQPGIGVDELYTLSRREAPLLAAPAATLDSAFKTPASGFYISIGGPGFARPTTIEALGGAPTKGTPAGWNNLEAARELLVKLLPSKPPKIPGYEISAFNDACEHLAGDLFKFFAVAEGFTGFLIADVSTHGMEAAIIMSLALKNFSLRAAGRLSPAATLSIVGRDMAGDLPNGKFITAFYAILNHATGELRYARAGHPPALLANAASGQVEELNASGPGLGIGTQEAYRERLGEGSARIASGEMLLLYSDGIVGARNSRGEPFGAPRLMQVLQAQSQQRSRGAITAILKQIHAHLGENPLQDDMTLIIVKRH